MMRTVFFLITFFLLPLFGIEQHFPVLTCPQETEEVLAPSFKGIVLLGSKDSANKINTPEAKGVQLIDLKVSKEDDVLKFFLQDYLGRPVTVSRISEIKKRIVDFYRKANHPIVYVEVPSQSISSGVLELIVYEGKLGEIRSTGNKYFKDEKLIGYMRNQKNQSVDMDLLIKDLEWMNRNPFRQTNSIFSPSGQNDVTDIELVTEDRWPWRFFAGVDNSGIRQSGRTRYFAGFNWGNVFNLDHILSFQFTSGSNIDNYWSTSLHYTAPLPWRHTLVTYGGYSHIKADLDTPGMKTKGYSAQASLRYEIPAYPKLNFLEDFLIGFDWKRTNTSIDQDGDLFFDQSVNLTQLMIGYNGGYEGSWYRVSGTIEVYGSPGRWLPDQSRKRYQELREGANNSYIYTRLAISPILEIGYGFTLHAKVRGQLSSTNLLASEQFGLGGWDTVRGYQVREVNADNVFIGNLEFRSPPIKTIGHLNKIPKDELIFLVFMDYAYGRNHKVFQGEVDHTNMMGVGPGVRYNIPPYINFRGDLGYKVWQPEQSDNHTHWRFEFGLIASY
ncbi:MAG: ShlB/FhaC/HecB family hemolysin secretion/activation protein [Simkaniaceae bacterium]|nr:MAG: ShlB/FhaC/HecB family hemolysin secretion/activation protein [Simkaniaceae bacterium]